MGVTFVRGRASNNGESLDLDFLVDSGAMYSLLPKRAWKQLGLKPKRSASFILADGSKVEREISECHLTFEQGDGHSPVILGIADDEPLLGVVTLEILGLVLNPLNRTIHPMSALRL